jgi:hypothetical protein
LAADRQVTAQPERVPDARRKVSADDQTKALEHHRDFAPLLRLHFAAPQRDKSYAYHPFG